MDVVEASIGHDHDMVTGLRLAGDKADDLIGRCESKCSFSTRPDAFGDTVGRECLSRRKMGCAKNAGNDDGIRRVKGLNKCLLEYPAPAGLGARLKNRPDTPDSMALAHGAERFMNSRRVMREVVVHDDAVHFAANLQPALDAFERRKRALNDVIRDSQFPG